MAYTWEQYGEVLGAIPLACFHFIPISINILPNSLVPNKNGHSGKNSSTKTNAFNPRWAMPVFFREWREHLMPERFDNQLQSRYIRAFAAFFARCNTAGKVSSIGVAKTYLEGDSDQGK